MPVTHAPCLHLFGATARVSSGIGSLVDDDIASVRTAIRAAATALPSRLDHGVLETWDARLARCGCWPRGKLRLRPARRGPALQFLPMPTPSTRWAGSGEIRDSDVHALRPLAPLAFDPAVADGDLSAALREHLPAGAPLVVIEDSPGHATTRAAEALAVSEYLAAHAARLALLQMDGHAALGLLAGSGHSAAFFVNALQAATLDALADARIEAMAPDAIARVTRLTAGELGKLDRGRSAAGPTCAASGRIGRSGPDACRHVCAPRYSRAWRSYASAIAAEISKRAICSARSPSSAAAFAMHSSRVVGPLGRAKQPAKCLPSSGNASASIAPETERDRNGVRARAWPRRKVPCATASARHSCPRP